MIHVFTQHHVSPSPLYDGQFFTPPLSEAIQNNYKHFLTWSDNMSYEPDLIDHKLTFKTTLHFIFKSKLDLGLHITVAH